MRYSFLVVLALLSTGPRLRSYGAFTRIFFAVKLNLTRRSEKTIYTVCFSSAAWCYSSWQLTTVVMATRGFKFNNLQTFNLMHA